MGGKKLSARKRNDYKKHHGNVVNYHFLGSDFELVRDHQFFKWLQQMENKNYQWIYWNLVL